MSRRDVEVVVKVGGAMLAHPAHFEAVVAAIGAAVRECRLLVVPGGGPLADVVRDLDSTIRPSDEAAHWMAILAMDQYAHLIAERITGGTIVESPYTIRAALSARRVPVLAPFNWLRDADPLPHSWDVTSDSIAAWIAGEIGATRLILVKPPDRRPEGLVGRRPKGLVGRRPKGLLYQRSEPVVDAYFQQALPTDVASIIVRADQIDVLRSALTRT